MNLKVYYQQLQETEEKIADRFAVVVSLETPDGGKAGVSAEVPRELAARLVVEHRARLANEEETAAFRAASAEAARKAEAAANSSKVQFAVLSEADLKLLRQQARIQKS